LRLCCCRGGHSCRPRYHYLRLVESRFGEQDPKARALFASFITLALLTHYSVAFVAADAVPSPLLLAAASRESRAGMSRAWTRALPANLLTFGGPLGVLGLVYVGHGPRWAQLTQHVAGFMFGPGKEGLIAFGLRTTRAEIELFTPIALTDLACWRPRRRWEWPCSCSWRCAAVASRGRSGRLP